MTHRAPQQHAAGLGRFEKEKEKKKRRTGFPESEDTLQSCRNCERESKELWNIPAEYGAVRQKPDLSGFQAIRNPYFMER
ncbi:MAG: hypothetical protein ACLUN5_14045, partial [Oscillospiraceae bacterium]